MRKLEEIKKIAVVARDEKNVVVELDKEVLRQVEEILLLPKYTKPEPKKKGSSNVPNDTKDLEILVKITSKKWRDKPLYLGLGFYDLYWKWFLGGSVRYVFKTEEERKEILKNKKMMPPNTKFLSAKTSYQEMLGIKKKTTGKLNFEGRNFVNSLSQIHDCDCEHGPKDSALACLVIYMIEAIRFSALRSMDLSLFRISRSYTHEWDDYIMDLLIDWKDYSKQIFKDEGIIDTRPIAERTINSFYTSREFCKLENVMVMDKSGIHQILAVALGSDDSNEWVEMIKAAKKKTKSNRK